MGMASSFPPSFIYLPCLTDWRYRVGERVNGVNRVKVQCLIIFLTSLPISYFCIFSSRLIPGGGGRCCCCYCIEDDAKQWAGGAIATRCEHRMHINLCERSARKKASLMFNSNDHILFLIPSRFVSFRSVSSSWHCVFDCIQLPDSLHCTAVRKLCFNHRFMSVASSSTCV